MRQHGRRRRANDRGRKDPPAQSGKVSHLAQTVASPRDQPTANPPSRSIEDDLRTRRRRLCGRCLEQPLFFRRSPKPGEYGPDIWLHKAGHREHASSHQNPDRPDWERLSLAVKLSPMDIITERAVAVYAARDSLALASTSPGTEFAVREHLSAPHPHPRALS